MSYGKNILIAIDQLLNTILIGKPDETLSARAYRCSQLSPSPKQRWVLACKLINILFFDHGIVSVSTKMKLVVNNIQSFTKINFYI